MIVVYPLIVKKKSFLNKYSECFSSKREIYHFKRFSLPGEKFSLIRLDYNQNDFVWYYISNVIAILGQ